MRCGVCATLGDVVISEGVVVILNGAFGCSNLLASCVEVIIESEIVVT